jgi:hypothetical protein
MQTFLPWERFDKTAACLDYKRLGKQRVECKQILQALAGKTAWSNHPAVRMWRGHAAVLIQYYEAIAAEWIKRGYNHTMTLPELPARFAAETGKPFWLGKYTFHQGHRNLLIQKDAGHYTKHFNSAPRGLWNIWPVTKQYTRLSQVERSGNDLDDATWILPVVVPPPLGLLTFPKLYTGPK